MTALVTPTQSHVRYVDPC